jgi:acyl-CoA reductase-like NAD-dependent aldehyde dehydrogenase
MNKTMSDRETAGRILEDAESRYFSRHKEQAYIVWSKEEDLIHAIEAAVAAERSACAKRLAAERARCAAWVRHWQDHAYQSADVLRAIERGDEPGKVSIP